MLENIALIKEVHHLLPTPKAQAEAKELLATIDLEHIGRNRLNQCSSLEIFYVMFVRAMMTDEENIFIVTPFFLIKKLAEVESVLEKIAHINHSAKNIIILDTLVNQSHYKGELCNIIK
jgi:ABC-type lipoprotein export system ATPase subunit